MTTRLGSLCSGYGGLDLAAEHLLGPLEHTWHAEIDPHASKVLAHHWPTTPNLGDLTAVDWAAVPPVDVLTGGFPCQPVSAAGQRKGVDDERWLFDDICAAVGRMGAQPRLLLFENVTGLLTANCGDAMACVIQGLAALGYVGRYRTVRASDVGAAHRRERVFIAAWPAADTESIGHGHSGPAGVGGIPAAAVAGCAESDGVTLLPTPMTSDGNTPPTELSHPKYSQLRDRVLTLLPTPRATDGTKGGPNQRGSSGDLMLPSAVVQLLPTPTLRHEARNATANRTAVKPTTNANSWTLSDVAYADRWGNYGPAIARWEAVTGRTAPDPTETGTKGQPRLAPAFVEWLMGLPAGWVTDHLPRNPALKCLGNGVVWQQAAHAYTQLLGAS